MLEHEPASWTAEVEHPASDQMPRMLEEGHGRVDAMQRLVQAMMHRSNRFWELALVSATQNGSSSAAPSTARAVSESRLPAHEAVGQKLLTATSSGAGVQEALIKRVWRLQEECDCNPKAPERDPIATRKDRKTRVRGGDHHAASLLGWALSGAGTHRVPAPPSAGPLRCGALLFCDPGRPTSDETPSPALRVDVGGWWCRGRQSTRYRPRGVQQCIHSAIPSVQKHT